MNKVWDVLAEAKNMVSTNIGKRITFEEMTSVWNQISQHVKRCLEQEKCIIIKEVGTFTLQKWKLDAGIHHEVNFFQPMFFLSRTLTEQYDLHQRKQYATDSMPVTVLNLCKVMKSCNYQKETVILCLDEVVQCLRYLIAEGKDIKLEFPELGELNVINTVVTFKFYEHMKPEEKIPEKPCYRYESAMKPYIKKDKVNNEMYFWTRNQSNSIKNESEIV